MTETSTTADTGSAGASGEEESGRSVFFPTDESQHCSRAFDWYCANLARPGDIVVFAHVVEPMYSSGASFPFSVEAMPMLVEDGRVFLEKSVVQAKELLLKYAKRADQADIKHEPVIYINTKPGQALVNGLNERRPDVIVMGHRGMSTIRRTFFGSVCDYVMHHAHLPIIIVPLEEKHV